MKRNFINKKKKKLININFSIFLIIFFVTIIFSSFYYKKIELFSLNVIQNFSDEYDYNLSIINISDLKYINKNKILNLFYDYRNKSIFFVPILKIADDIKKIRWVKNINIKNDYHKTITVFLEEEEPIGIFFNDNKKILFSNNLVFLDILENDNEYSNLIIFSGKNAVNNSKKLIANLDHEFKKNVLSAAFIGNRRWNLILNNSILIKMPEQNIKNAIKDYNKIYLNFSNKDLNDISSIDLRVQNQAIIKYRNLLND